jgi:hypothetical protein
MYGCDVLFVRCSFVRCYYALRAGDWEGEFWTAVTVPFAQARALLVRNLGNLRSFTLVLHQTRIVVM